MSRTQKRRAAWLARVNRKDLHDADVKSKMRVCSAQFVSESRSRLWEKTSLDWAPSINLGYSTTAAVSSTSLARHDRAKRRAEDKLLVISQHQAQKYGIFL